jgi:hypothetical protein
MTAWSSFLVPGHPAGAAGVVPVFLRMAVNNFVDGNGIRNRSQAGSSPVPGFGFPTGIRDRFPSLGKMFQKIVAP